MRGKVKYVIPRGTIYDFKVKGNEITIYAGKKVYKIRYRSLSIRRERIVTKFHKVYSILLIAFILLFLTFLVFSGLMFKENPEEAVNMLLVYIPIFTVFMVVLSAMTYAFFHRPVPLLYIIDEDGTGHYFIIHKSVMQRVVKLVKKLKTTV